KLAFYPLYREPCQPTVLVVVAVVCKRNLPAKPATAGIVVAIGTGLSVEDGLSKCQPARPIRGRVRELHLSGCHGGHAPETLVIVAERGGDVMRHIGLVFADLELHGLHDEVVVRGVAGPSPVIDQSPPHGTTLPPVVVAGRRRSWEDAGRLSG